MRFSALAGALLCLSLSSAMMASTTVRARPKPPDADPVAPRCHSLEAGEADVRAAWGQATRTNSCFFFSGPFDLGRDDHLGARARYRLDGDRVVVRFGNLRFSGRLRGDRVQLRRVSSHEFGSTWRVTETIDARFVDDNGCRVLRGTYRYEECDTSREASCPGTCTISAPVTFTGE